MENFAEQCLDLARSILEHNLSAIQEDGTLLPASTEGGEETMQPEEPGHALLALGEYYRATQETKLGSADIVDLAARCLTQQAFAENTGTTGMAYTALGLLSFGPAKDRNPVWERLFEDTQTQLANQLNKAVEAAGNAPEQNVPSTTGDHLNAFKVAQTVTHYSLEMGTEEAGNKADATPKALKRLTDRLKNSQGFIDATPENLETGSLGGVYDIEGLHAFVLLRQALQLHSNVEVRERNLPGLRTNADKYLKLLADLTRQDGLGWAYGQGAGAYGQMYAISLLLQNLRDGWVTADKKSAYQELARRLFQHFFASYLDLEHGYVVVRDAERGADAKHTTRKANFDAARMLCQWSRLARGISGNLAQAQAAEAKTISRFVLMEKSNKKEQGLFVYREATTGLQLQLPLMGGALPFPQCPGIFDAPVNAHAPIMVPELTFGQRVTMPGTYGKKCTAGLAARGAFFFSYEQPELVTAQGQLATGIGSCKTHWTFKGTEITAEFTYMVKNPVQLDGFRLQMMLSAPHTRYPAPGGLQLGEGSHGATVLKDDFGAQWQPLETVTDNPDYKTYQGKLHYVQTLARTTPLLMRPGTPYRLQIQFNPHVTSA